MLIYAVFSDETQHRSLKSTSRPYLIHTSLKALQTVVILDNAQSLVKLTP